MSFLMTMFTRLLNVDMVGQLWDQILLHEAGTAILIEVCFLVLEAVVNRGWEKDADGSEILQAIKSIKLTNSEAQ